jgi:hypothetical protein
LELRTGYATVAASTISNTTIHSLIPFTMFDQTRYVIRFQGTTPYQVAVASGTVTAPTFATGATFASASPGQSYQYGNRLYYGNGTDQRVFDGVTWRKSGITALTPAQVAGVQVASFDRELSSAQLAAIVVAQAGAGNFQPTTFAGIALYVILFDYVSQALCPGVAMVGNRQQVASVNQQFQFSVLPNVTGSHTYKLFAWAGDSQNSAYFSTKAAPVNVSSITVSGVTATVTTSIAHGLATNDITILANTLNTKYNRIVQVTSTGANTFTFTVIDAAQLDGNVGAGGTSTALNFVTEAVTTFNLTVITQDTSIIANDPNRGVPASTIGGPNAGFQFYASIYNASNAQHVSNRVAIGPRVVPPTRSLIFIYGLPALADPEWVWLIGRTGDGLQVPYASVDTNANRFTIQNGTVNTFLQEFGTIDGNSELPFRNTPIPAACDKFAVVGDYVWAADSISPTLRRSGSALLSRNGQFVGDPAQSWFPSDSDTFPTNQTPTMLAETDGMLFVTTQTDCAFLADNLGTPMWIGPYTKGGAGKRAFVKTDHGFFWVSWDLELCTIVDGKPMGVSDEYNAGELALLGDAFKQTIELQYFRSRTLDRDELLIFGQKADGTPHKIVIDFKLLDARSPWGQGRSEEHLGPLATVYTTAQVINSANVRTVWAGATNGQIYEQYSGVTDLGVEYSADLVWLTPTGLERLQVPYLDFFGDGNVVVSYGRQLNATVDQSLDTDLTVLTPLTESPMQVPGRDDLACWRVHFLDDEMVGHLYLRFQLTGHSADGNLTLSSPPHCPLETYGRVYAVAPMVGDTRGRA